MTTYAHKKIIKEIETLDREPKDAVAFDSWTRAAHHLDYLQANAKSDELIILCFRPSQLYPYHCRPSNVLTSEAPEALLHWSSNPFTSIAGYASSLSMTSKELSRR
ncbi:MAG TPA: hypothetical protein VKS78_19710 [Roseiarcus sp.]|nr:hypothetical protein [Roseiarcus sp.]